MEKCKTVLRGVFGRLRASTEVDVGAMPSGLIWAVFAIGSRRMPMRIRGAGPPPRPRKNGENEYWRADARIYSERSPRMR